MAKGISELDVHHAADDIVSRGERPTVERIRAHLGTGSPNTVTRWLETWWSSVGTRLRQRAHEAGRPDVPGAVITLAQRCWKTALEEAGGHANAALAAERTELDQQRELLAAEHERRAEEARQLQHAQAQSLAAQGTIDALQSQMESITARSKELEAQRDGAYARADQLEVQLQAQREIHERQQQLEQRERAELMAYTRSTEERLNVELDRARQEQHALSSRLRQQESESRTTVIDLERQLVLANQQRLQATTAAEHERQGAAHLRERADLLQTALASVERALAAATKASTPARRKRTRETNSAAGQARAAPKASRTIRSPGKR